MSNTMYFGHPVNAYNTLLEEMLIQKIIVAFPGWDIENPNQPHHQDGYERWKRIHGSGMGYYFEVILPQCHAGIFLPFRDGYWGTGVFAEAEFLFGLGRPIYRITHEGSVSEEALDYGKALTVKETIARIRTPSGEIRPY